MSANKINTNLGGDFSICQTSGCGKSFDITDKSGVYSFTSNVEGWGSPNPLPSNVEYCTLTMIDPNGDSFVFDLYEPNIFPNINNSAKRVNHSVDLIDGVYEFIYKIQGSSIGSSEILWEVTNRKYILFSCNTQCCSDKLFASINFSSSSCGSSSSESKLSLVTKIRLYLEGAHYAACCGNVEKAKSLLAQAKFLCLSENCNGCK